MPSSHPITTNLPFGLFSAGTLSGSLPKLARKTSAIFYGDDAAPVESVNEDKTEEAKKKKKTLWED